MHLATPAIVCAVLPHGEAGAVARLLTPLHGLQPGYVRGGRSRRLRPVLQPGNLVSAEFRARTDEQLAALIVELNRSRAPLAAEPLPALAIGWATAITAMTLPEGQPYPAIFEGLAGLLSAIEAADAARDWMAALVRFELLLLQELGFGLDLSCCAATGATGDLAWISPRTGAAVSSAAGAPYADRLLPLPRFLIDGGSASWGEVLAGLRLTGRFVERDLLNERRAVLLPARARLIDRVGRLARA
jgi:DNA repair protein RecO (recombination protein O)